MKKILMFMTALVIFSVNVYTLKADCNSITKEALEVEKEMLKINDEEGVKISTKIYNLTENLYVTVLNDYDNTPSTYHYSDVKDGILTIDTTTILNSINYVIKVYSEDTTCGVEPLKTLNYTTPKYNDYSTVDKCRGRESEIEMCSAFYDNKGMTPEEFMKKLDKEIKKQEEANHSFMYYVSKYYLFVLIPVILVILVYVVRIIILKRGKAKNA